MASCKMSTSQTDDLPRDRLSLGLRVSACSPIAPILYKLAWCLCVGCEQNPRDPCDYSTIQITSVLIRSDTVGSCLGSLHFTRHCSLRSIHAPSSKTKTGCFGKSVLSKTNALYFAEHFEPTNDEARAHPVVIMTFANRFFL